MEISEIRANIADQDKGAWLDIRDPVKGEPTGMRFCIVGPDSETAHRARLKLSDDLAEMADIDGRVSAENREKARRNSLAALVMKWEGVEEDGKPVPFNTKNLITLIKVRWIDEQVDAFAGDRRNFMGAP